MRLVSLQIKSPGPQVFMWRIQVFLSSGSAALQTLAVFCFSPVGGPSRTSSWTTSVGQNHIVGARLLLSVNCVSLVLIWDTQRLKVQFKLQVLLKVDPTGSFFEFTNLVLPELGHSWNRSSELDLVPSPTDMVIDSMLASGQLEEGLDEKVREAMLKRHHHQNEKKLSNRIPLVRSFADIGKKHSDSHLLERNGERPGRSVSLTLGSESTRFTSRKWKVLFKPLCYIWFVTKWIFPLSLQTEALSVCEQRLCFVFSSNLRFHLDVLRNRSNQNLILFCLCPTELLPAENLLLNGKNDTRINTFNPNR